MANRIDNLNALDWDDSALIRAYNKGMSLRAKDLEKENNTAKENFKTSAKRMYMWKVGDYCRAIYYGDDLWYEAIITYIDKERDMCTVSFIGYDEECEVEVYSLDKSLGKKAIKKQKKNAKKNGVTSDIEENASGADDTMNDRSANHRSHRKHHSHSKKRHHGINETRMLDQSNYTAAESTFHSAYPLARYPEMPTAMAPAFMPPCSDLVPNNSLNSMLTAWYMAGYYTAIHQVQKGSPQQHCCNHQAYNYHQ